MVGAYKCQCRDGYYFPHPNNKYFNGTKVEDAFSNKTLLANPNMFACKPCRRGCTTCMDDSACIVETNYNIRYSVLGVTLLCIVICLAITGFVWRCREVQVLLLLTFICCCVSVIFISLLFLLLRTFYCPLHTLSTVVAGGGHLWGH